MAAIPAAQMGKGEYVEWLRLTQILIDLSAIAVGDLVSAAQTKVTLEQNAH